MLIENMSVLLEEAQALQKSNKTSTQVKLAAFDAEVGLLNLDVALLREQIGKQNA